MFPCGDDCDDDDNRATSSGVEVCDDGADNDCDGRSDSFDTACRETCVDGWCYQAPLLTTSDFVGAAMTNVGDVWLAVEGGGLLRVRGPRLDASIDDAPAAVRALWAADDDDVWAATSAGLVHFDGVAWQADDSVRASLNDVLGFAPDAILAVGDGGAFVSWDGVRWAARESGTTQDLTRVTGVAADDAWLAGPKSTLTGENVSKQPPSKQAKRPEQRSVSLPPSGRQA